MIRALAWKELRETWGLAAAGGLVLFALVSYWMDAGWLPGASPGWRGNRIPFLADDAAAVALFAALLAAVLGGRQSAWEGITGTFPFLLHQPIRRSSIVTVKLAVGVGMYALAVGLPVLTYALWAAWPGTHASPFSWSWTWPVWQACLAQTVIYAGAFLTGLRPARWPVRLLPLAGAAVATFALSVLPWWWLALAGMAVVDTVFVVVIFDVAATRDYA